MVKGFDRETRDLTSYELNEVLPHIRAGLLKRVGAAHAVTNREIVAGLRSWRIAIGEPRVRKIINHIRTTGMIPRLIATSSGYYVAETRQEVIDYIDSLKNRENAIKAVRTAIESQLQSIF